MYSLVKANIAAILVVLISATHGLASGPSLVMIEQHGCYYCIRWKEEIGPIYPKTSAGQFAPLVVTDIDEPEPTGVKFQRRINYTPTFVLIEDGQEIGRIEGYPGEDFFWGLLEHMLADKTEFELPG